jgi:hypothetical protein
MLTWFNNFVEHKVGDDQYQFGSIILSVSVTKFATYTHIRYKFNL